MPPGRAGQFQGLEDAVLMDRVTAGVVPGIVQGHNERLWWSGGLRRTWPRSEGSRCSRSSALSSSLASSKIWNTADRGPGDLHQLHSDSRRQPLGVEFTKRFGLG